MLSRASDPALMRIDMHTWLELFEDYDEMIDFYDDKMWDAQIDSDVIDFHEHISRHTESPLLTYT